MAVPYFSAAARVLAPDAGAPAGTYRRSMAQRIVIVGAGIAGLEALAVLHAQDRAVDAEVVVVSPDDAFTVRALGVGEPFGLGHPHRYPLGELVERLGGRLVSAKLSKVDAPGQAIELDDGTTLDYDALLVAVGARSVPAYDHGISFDRATSPADFDEALHDVRRGLAGDIAIAVPPGLRWTLPAYELALLLRGYEGADLDVSIVSAEHAPLEAFGPAASESVAEVLAEAAVRWRHGLVADVPADTAMLVGDHWSEHDRIVHLPVPIGPRIPGLPCDRGGFVEIDASGRSPAGDRRIWAVGDGATTGQGSGSIAAQQALRAARDILLELFDHAIPDPPPLTRYGLLRTARGPLYLRAEVGDPEGTSTWSRSPLWWPASKVAAPWLTSALTAPPLPRVEAVAR